MSRPCRKNPVEDWRRLALFGKDLGICWQAGGIIRLPCVLFFLGLALCWPQYSPPARGQPLPAGHAANSITGFQDFLQTLWPLAEQKGINRATFDTALASLEPDPATPAASTRQAEFDKPLKAYLDEAVSPRRVTRGRECLRMRRAELADIEHRYGVPAAVAVAAFGIESDYGKAKGEKDIIRSLATLAYLRQDRPVFRDELLSALVILDKGTITRAAMKGSWAGAMGGPQFLPSAYLKYAVSYSGRGTPDIWNSPVDSLASIANFLRQSGWHPGLFWGIEVTLPENFRFASLLQSFAAFAAQGVRGASGEEFPRGEATLFLPSGAAGPAFLLSANYWVLKAYNNSDSYALSLALLGQRIEGRPWLRGRWPAGEVFLTRTQKTEVQRLLEKLGFYHGPIDGRFGQASRDAIHAFQNSAKISPADGFATPELSRRLAAEASHLSSGN
ncbi:MAG: lytic murein transglycosylase [Beijerinckiaceae bacterium]|nr:lytic murein transglycosylase [Beijerinckiaceae bacterium]MCI0735817.1 lytic murein transglycosylase [Beijerinckiaceae bacterium]